MLWDCEKGDCQGIADSLEFCPVCGTARPPREYPAETPAEPPEPTGAAPEPGPSRPGAARSGPTRARGSSPASPGPAEPVESASAFPGWEDKRA